MTFGCKKFTDSSLLPEPVFENDDWIADEFTVEEDDITQEGLGLLVTNSYSIPASYFKTGVSAKRHHKGRKDKFPTPEMVDDNASDVGGTVQVLCRSDIPVLEVKHEEQNEENHNENTDIEERNSGEKCKQRIAGDEVSLVTEVPNKPDMQAGMQLRASEQSRRSAKMLYYCSKCGKKFSSSVLLERHRRLHSARFLHLQCNVCRQPCRYKKDLERHMRVHTGEKPFKCDVCNHSYALKSDLKRHLMTHSGEKPHACHICDYASITKNHLVRHLRTHSGEKPFKCDVCNYSAIQKTDLTRHLRTHSGEKPFECDVCNHSFIQKYNLVKHQRIHSGEKPFECDICKQRFALKNHLVSHIRIHIS